MTRPNILLILADQMRYDCVGAAGNTSIRTPHIDSIAHNGFLFTRPYCCLPICMPQRVSLMTGVYPSVHGTVCNGIKYQGRYPLLPELLHEAGYQTFTSGKIHLNPIACGMEIPPEEPGEVDHMPYMGYEQVYDVEGYTSDYLKMISEGSPELLEAANHRPEFDPNGPFQASLTPIPLKKHRSTVIADHAIQMIEKRDISRPFFMHCSFWDPHHPFDPPAPYDRMYDPSEVPIPICHSEEEFGELPEHFQTWYIRNWGTSGKTFKDHSQEDWLRICSLYYGMISLIDDQVGRLLGALEAEGIAEDTLIIFSSDHGELLGDHGLGLKGPFFYEGLLKVPLVIFDPRNRKDGFCSINEPVMSYDIMPTVLEYCGLPVPEVTAKSLFPLMQGEEREVDTILIEGEHTDMTALLDGEWKIIVYRTLDEGQLYNLGNDPDEKDNLWEHEPVIRMKMLQKLCQAQLANHPPAGRRTSIW